MTDIDRLRMLYESIHDSTTNGAPSPVVVERADAIIAALEAEVKRLRCCGNCEHRDEETLDYSGSYFVCLTELSIEVDCEDQCRFTPSRWQRREG